MTDNTHPSGEVIFSNQLVSGSSKGAWTAFNPSETEGWINDSTMPYIHVDNYVGYTFTSAAKAVAAKFSLLYYNMTNVTISGKFQGYDGSDWIDVCNTFTYTISDTSGTPIIVPFTKNIDAYTKYRWICTTDASTNKHLGIKLQFYTSADPATQVLIHSAAQDDIYYLDNGSPVIIAHTDDYGDAVIDRDLLPTDEYLTLYSTIAKDPDNLGNAYSKTVHFSKYLTEVYVMPISSIYWYGFKIKELSIESRSSSPYYGTVTYNTNEIDLYGYHSGNWGGPILTPMLYTVENLDLSKYNSVKSITSRTSVSSVYPQVGLRAGVEDIIPGASITEPTISVVTCDISSESSGYPAISSVIYAQGSQCHVYCSALWLE
jgi:hypothetical protein